MPIRDLFTLLYTTVLAFCALYAPQPLLPTFSQQFDINMSQAGLLITVALLPLSIAPIAYGFLLETVSSLKVLQWSVLLLALSHIPLLWLDDFNAWLAVRLVQGLLLPAIFTSLMTYLSSLSRPHLVRRKIAFYIAATILGGFLGRVLTGVIDHWWHWRWTFFVLLLGLLLAWVLLLRIQAQVQLQLMRPSWHTLTAVLRQPIFLHIYGLIFIAFFCFASLLNSLPFRLTELSNELSALHIAFSYLGYLIGLVIAINAVRLAHWLGGEVVAVIWGFGLYGVAVLLFNFANPFFIVLNMFVFCAGMFLIHSILSGYLNHLATERKGMVNGLYVAFYYLGGTIGSFVPSFLYQAFGWHWYLTLLLLLIVLGGGLLRSLHSLDLACRK